MNEIEAIKSLKNIIEYWTYKPTEVEAAKLAIEALEKQIPKKPIVSNCAESNTYRCKCGRFLKQIYFDRAGTIQGYEQAYCPGCGQAIDWSVEE